MLISSLLLLLLLLLVSLIWMPVVLHLNTSTNEYYVHLKGLAKASLEPDKEEIMVLRLEIFFLKFNFYPLRKRKMASKKKMVEPNKSNYRKSRIRLQTALRVLRSFKVKKFLLNIDTGDCISNAKLYPLFALLNYRIGGFRVNFDGRNEMIIHIQNTPLRIIKSIINS